MPIPADAEVRFISPLGDQLLFHRMETEEELGRPFKYHLTLLSERGDLVLSDLLGQVVTVELDLPDTTPTPNEGTRYFNGYVTRFSRQGAHRRFHAYSATVRPWLWLLSQASNCRIFQDKTVPEIIKEVFRSHGFTDFKESLIGSYPSRDFVVQYRETDLNFVSRLMEHEGIYYFFTHEAAKHTLVLADSVSAHGTVKGYEEVPYLRPGSLQQALPDHLDDWGISQQIEPGKVILNDFNFEAPKLSLLAQRLAPNPHERADFEDYEYPGRYLKSSDGESYARLRLEELNARYEQARGRCNARGLSVGSLFNPTGLPVDSDNREYLLTASCIAIEGPGYESQEGGQDGETFRSTFAAIASKCPFRTERSAPRPTVPGPQTATVVGQAGEEIWTDKYGRVKVQFHWDREGQRDENSSCWVRVAQVWAGKQWGAMHIPRIGQEVIVDFLEGDPDKPIITGRVYNADNMPPYTLPENRTQSGIKSRSSKGGSPSNFNEIRFEDLKGKEELHIQAEKDLTILVKNDEMRTVGHDRTKTVENDETSRIARNRTEEVGQDEEIAIHGNRTETVDKDENITITGNRNNNVGKDETITITGRRTETVGKDETISITGKRVVSVDKDENLTVAGSRTQSVAGNDQLAVTKRMILDVGDEFVIKAGAASLSMKKDGTIVLKGVDLAFKASGKIDAKASGEVNIKGSKVGGN